MLCEPRGCSAIGSLVLPLLLAGCLEPIPENTLFISSTPHGSVTGTVREACQRTPLGGATVTMFQGLDSRSQIADANGAFRFDGMPLGSLWRVFARQDLHRYLLGRENAAIGDLQQSEDLSLGLDPQSGEPELPPTRSIDLLLVVDDSPGMKEHQQRFIDGFGSFITGLFQGIRGNRAGSVTTGTTRPETPQDLDLQIGVISGGACGGGARVALTHAPTCSMPGPSLGWTIRRTLSGDSQKGQLVESYSISPERSGWSSGWSGGGSSDDAMATVTSAARCLAGLGEAGCTYQRPVSAAVRFLAPGGPSFRRPGVALIVLILTHGDECSSPPTDGSEADDASCIETGVSCGFADGDGRRWNCHLTDESEGAVQSEMVELQSPEKRPLFLAVVAGDRGRLATGADEQGRPRIRSVCLDSPLQVTPSFHLRGLVDRLRPYASLASLCGDLSDFLSNLGTQAAQTTLLWSCARP